MKCSKLSSKRRRDKVCGGDFIIDINGIVKDIHERLGKFQSCLNWLEGNAIGLEASRLTFGMDNDMLGAWAQQDYEVNDVLFSADLLSVRNG